jgi:iodotyrosine deiodinase
MPALPPKQRLEFERHSKLVMLERAQKHLKLMTERRSVREFSDEAIPLEVLRACIETAGQAPSGANKQPWTFVLVTDPQLKKQIRTQAEAEERAFYKQRASKRWLEDLVPLDTNSEKEFLDVAPALIVVFAKKYGRDKDEQHYYVNESVGIASGFLLSALHNAGLATLTHTPSPMGFLRQVLNRPENERAYLLIPVGYPAPNCEVPDIARKTRDEYLHEY